MSDGGEAAYGRAPSGTRHVSIVTGASRGIGAATARQLARAGADLVIVARSQEGLERTAVEARAFGSTVATCPIDLASSGAGPRVVDTALERFGQLDSVVNNAASLEPISPLADVDLDGLEQTLRLDVLAPLSLLQRAIPMLRETEGRVLNVNSTAATVPIAGLGAYCAAKAALTAVTRVLAIEEPTITWLLVQPGPVDTHMHILLRDAGEGISQERRDYYHHLQESGALVAPDVAGARFSWLARRAPATWSGRELEPDDADVQQGINEEGWLP